MEPALQGWRPWHGGDVAITDSRGRGSAMTNREVKLSGSELKALLLSDEDGYLWVRDFDYRLPAEREERWNVFDPNGRYLGALEMPQAFALMTITPKYIAGVARNRAGVETVRVFELKKPARK